MRIRLTVMAVMVVFSLSACGSKEVSAGKEVQPMETADKMGEPSTQGEAEESGLSVELTIPKEWLDGDSGINIDRTVFEEGDNHTENMDGSITYVMNKSKHRELLSDIKKNLEEACDGYINGESAVESFDRITFSDDLTKFSIYVDRTKFSDFDTITAIGFYAIGEYYQLVNLVPDDEIDVQVDFIDKDTDEVLNSGTLGDMKKTQNEDPDGIITEADALYEIDNWYTGSIWNNFVDFQSFREWGTDCTGSNIDIEFAYEEFKEAYALKSEYDSYIKALPDEYSKLKKVWEKMNEQIGIIYKDLEENGIKEGGPYLDLDLLDQYSPTFHECIRQ